MNYLSLLSPKKKYVSTVKAASYPTPLVPNSTSTITGQATYSPPTTPTKTNLSSDVGATTPTSPTMAPAKKDFIQSQMATSNPVENAPSIQPGMAPQDTTVGGVTPPAPKPDPYRAAFDSYISSLQPSKEETDARKYLSSLLDTSQREEQAALERGETLGFASGEAARVNRNRAFDISAASGALEGLTGQRQAMTEAQKARLEFEKSLIPEEKSLSEQYGTGSVGEYNFAKSQGYQGSFTDYQNEDANRKKSIAAAGVGGLSNEAFKRIGQISDDVRADPDIKDFVQIRDGYERVKTGANLNNAQGDLSLLFGYMKLLDPTSVVRETEFANAEAAMGFAQQILNIPAKLIKGNRLTPEARQQFSTAADAIYKAKEGNYKKAYDFYENRANVAGVDPTQVLRDFGSTPSDVADNDPLGIRN